MERHPHEENASDGCRCAVLKIQTCLVGVERVWLLTDCHSFSEELVSLDAYLSCVTTALIAVAHTDLDMICVFN